MDQSIKVLKFGGTSLRDVKAIHHCAALVKKECKKGTKIIVVASAMGSQTDELLKLAFSVTSIPKQRELDMLVSTGERVSCALFAMALNDIGLKALSLTGSQCGILTNKVHQHAEIVDIKCDRIFSALESFDVVVVAGFQGVDPKSKEITTLGRGGSDLTAVALADELGADACYIYTDVNGIMTLDPKSSSEAKTVGKVSWEMAHKLSCSGAKVLHYRASSLALKKKLPLWVLNTCDPGGAKTLVSPLCDKGATFLTYKKGQSFLEIKIKKSGEKESLFSAVLDFLGNSNEVPFFSEEKKAEKGDFFLRFSISSSLVLSLEEFLRGHVSGFKASLNVVVRSFLCASFFYEDLSQKKLFEEKMENLLKKKNLVFFEKEEGKISFGFHEEEGDSFLSEIFKKMKKS